MLPLKLSRNRNKVVFSNHFVRLFSAKTTDTTTSSSDKQEKQPSMSKINSWLLHEKVTKPTTKDAKKINLAAIPELIKNSKSLEGLKSTSLKTMNSLKTTSDKTMHSLKNNERLKRIPNDVTNQLNTIYKTFNQIEYRNNMDTAYKSIANETFQQSLDRLKKGVGMEVSDAKAWAKLLIYKNRGLHVKELATYEEFLAKKNFERDGIKSGYVLSVPFIPFLPYYMALLPCLAPRKLISRNFWSAKQKQVYLIQNHYERSQEYQALVDDMKKLAEDKTLNKKTRLLIDGMATKLNMKEVMTNNDLVPFMQVCQKYPFSLSDGNISLLRSLCRINEVSAVGAASGLSSRLQNVAADILDMDEKLREMNLDELSPEVIATAAYMRGLDSTSLPHEANLYWLKNWINLSQFCNKGDSSFVLQSMAILSMNYNVWKYHLRVFG